MVLFGAQLVSNGMSVAIIGTGHVGLVNGVGLAELGHSVICADLDKEKIRSLKQGVSHIYEPGLAELLVKNIAAERLTFTTDTDLAIKASQVIFVTVGTPSREDGSADLSQVEEVTRDIARLADSFKLVVEKSTVPVKTGDWMKRTLRSFTGPNGDFEVASMPEFLREGAAVYDFFHPSRMVIGVETARAESMLRELFKDIDAPFLITDMQSAELIKHASNCFLAMKISYINAIAQICERVGADVTKVAKGMGLDPRIGPDFMEAGIGYGGYCFPKDVSAFIKISEELGYDFKILKEVQSINQQQRAAIPAKLRKAMSSFDGKTIGVLGLAFKPNTDDIRDAPSIELISVLLHEGAIVRAYDPAAIENTRLFFNEDIQYFNDPYEMVIGCDALILVTEWPEFQLLDMARIQRSLAIPLFVDGRNVFDPSHMRSLGFIYDSVGR
jgi:UDPglucose 6-dehydrogenase